MLLGYLHVILGNKGQEIFVIVSFMVVFIIPLTVITVCGLVPFTIILPCGRLVQILPSASLLSRGSRAPYWHKNAGAAADTRLEEARGGGCMGRGSTSTHYINSYPGTGGFRDSTDNESCFHNSPKMLLHCSVN